MQVTATPAPKSSVLLEIEVPPDRLDRAVRDAVRRLSRRTRVPGFRPGKAPRPILERVLGPSAVLDEAVETLMQSTYREAVIEQGIVPLTDAEVEVVEAVEGKPLRFKATVQVRPEVTLGDYSDFKFAPEIEDIDDEKVDKVIEELRDQNATLAAVEDRGAKDGDWAVIGFAGTRNGEAFEGGSAERMPLVIGEDRLIPGFEANLVGLRPGDSKGFEIMFPEDYGEPTLAGQEAHFEVELKELREKILPDADDEFARSMGEYPDLPGLRADVELRLRRNALDRARHEFSDKIIDYAVANATIDLPDALVDQEVEVMHDEFRSTLTRQGISEDAYLKATEKTNDDLQDRRGRRDRRPRRGGRGAGGARPQPLSRSQDGPLFRVRAGSELHSQHAPPDAGGGDPGGPLAGRPPGASGATPRRGRRTDRRRCARGRGDRLDRRHRSGVDPRG